MGFEKNISRIAMGVVALSALAIVLLGIIFFLL